MGSTALVAATCRGCGHALTAYDFDGLCSPLSAKKSTGNTCYVAFTSWLSASEIPVKAGRERGHGFIDWRDETMIIAWDAFVRAGQPPAPPIVDTSQPGDIPF